MKYTKIEKEFRNWVYLIARWKVLDFIKPIHLRDTIPLDIGDTNLLEKLPAAGIQDKKIEIQKINEFLPILFHQLSDEQKDIVYLRFFEERTHEEIAYILNKNEFEEKDIEKEKNRIRKVSERAQKKFRKFLMENPEYNELFKSFLGVFKL